MLQFIKKWIFLIEPIINQEDDKLIVTIGILYSNLSNERGKYFQCLKVLQLQIYGTELPQLDLSKI